jgi:hypothetical protein
MTTTELIESGFDWDFFNVANVLLGLLNRIKIGEELSL